MVMGNPFTYDIVIRDSAKYPQMTNEGKFPAWWERYLADEGFEAVYRPFLDLYQLPFFNGSIVGILAMVVPIWRMVHLVAVDEAGVIDPRDNAPDHIDIAEYIRNGLGDGFQFDKEFLAVNRGTNRRT